MNNIRDSVIAEFIERNVPAIHHHKRRHVEQELRAFWQTAKTDGHSIGGWSPARCYPPGAIVFSAAPLPWWKRLWMAMDLPWRRNQ